MKNRYLDLSNPAFIFAASWAIPLVLVEMRLMNHIVELRFSTFALIASNVFSFIFIHLLFSLRPKNLRQNIIQSANQPLILRKLRLFSGLLLVIWAIGTLVNIFYSSGVPLLWLMADSERTYADFGIPTLSGLLNSLFMFSLTGFFLDYAIRGSWKSLMIVLFFLPWQIIVISRAALCWTLLQMLGAWLAVRKVSIRNMSHAAIASFIFIIAFGVIGDYRVGENSIELFKTYINPEYSYLLDVIPSGFFWVYAYATSGINNINFNIDSITPLYTFNFSTLGLFPTVIRSMLFTPGVHPVVLVTEAFNVSTFYAGFLADFGPFGAFSLVAILQLLVMALYVRAKTNRIWALLASAILFRAVSLSIFWDTFTSLPSVAQLFLVFGFRWFTRNTPTDITTNSRL